jgi:hypothetical protein
MSKQTLNLQDDWERIKEKFREHFGGRNLEINSDRIKYSRSGEHLEIKRNGEASGAMPLHSNEMEDANQIQISDSEVRIYSNSSEYIFRR